ncbi:MAG: TIM barrel protein [Acidobacteria bacterium]|nr:TIM barrel protein [Acidobacteriota bacterium]
MRKFAANLGFLFTERPFLERFGAAARAGFAAVELLVPFDTPAEAIARELERHRLVNLGFNIGPGDWAAGERGIASLPGREEEFRRSVAQALAYAETLRTPQFHPLAGIVPPGGDRARHRATYVENLRFAAREAARHGRTVVIETLNARDMPGYFLTTWADADAIREAVGEPNLKLQMDLYHTQVAEGDLTTKLRRYAGAIVHVQVAGVPDRHEPDEGEVDYRHIFRVLDEVGYSGWIGCEYRPRGRTEDGLGWRERREES